MSPTSRLGAALALVGASILSGCAAPGAPSEAVVIDMETSRYEYAPGTAVSINVTLGQVVVLRVTSTDVTHGLAIEGYQVHEEIPAGKTVEIRFTANRAGDFTIYCTVFCGPGHPQHKGTLHVAAA